MSFHWNMFYKIVFVFLCFYQNIKCNLMDSTPLGDSLKQCLISQQPSLIGRCLGVGAITKLQTLDSHPEFDLIDGVTMAKENQEFRDNYNIADTDPSDVRGIVDSLGHVFGHRTLKWDMDFVYPGLQLRVAPSVSSDGILEFILDPHREMLTKQSLKELGTGRLLARQLLVPFLMGFKFNVATVLPILFALLALIAKKAVIISKIALIISSAYALGTLLLGNGNKNPQNYYTHNQGNYHSSAFNPSFGNYRFPTGHDVYRGINEQPNEEDQLHLYANLEEIHRRQEQEKSGRNFAWSEDEKLAKKKV